MNRLAPKTAKSYRLIFNAFMTWKAEHGREFKDFSADELVEYQKNCDKKDWFNILDLVQNYILSLKGLRTKSMKVFYSTVRSFFKHNRAELPRDDFKINSDVEKVRGTLTAEEIRDVVVGSKTVYRAIFLSILQGGMDVSGFEYWNRKGYGELMEQIGNDIVKIYLPGRKGSEKSFYTFIGGDAVKAIRDYLPERPKDAEAIFVNQYGDPIKYSSLSIYWRRHLAKLGLIKRVRGDGTRVRYGKNLHEFRDIFRSLWKKSPAKASVAEFCMGHIVDPLEYNKAHHDEKWVRGEYRKALPMLQIMSSDTPFGKVDVDEVESLRAQVADLQAQVESMMYAFNVERELTRRRELAELDKKRGES